MCLVYYLNLLSAQHCHFPHVPERLKQVVVELSRCLQQPSIRLVLLRVHLQQLHHAVHGFVFVQHLHQDMDRKVVAGKPVQSEIHRAQHIPLQRSWTRILLFCIFINIDKSDEKTKANVFFHSNQS